MIWPYAFIMADYEWQGPNPFFLVIRTYALSDGQRSAASTVIDLNERGWIAKHQGLMRVPGIWMLCSKERSNAEGVLVPVLIQTVDDGDQPYYVAKHVGVMSFSDEESQEVVCYGIGKKLPGGQVQRLWVMPNGMICGGEDVYQLGSDMVKGQL